MLQAGSDDEREQRIVTLSAELVTAGIQEDALQRRCQALAGRNARLVSEKSAAVLAHGRLQAADAAARQSQARLQTRCDRLARDVADAQTAARHAQASADRAIKRASAAATQRDAAVSELAGAHDALKSAAARHAAQLEQERTSARAASAAHSLDATAELSAPEPGYMDAVRSALDHLQRSLDQATSSGSSGARQACPRPRNVACAR